MLSGQARATEGYFLEGYGTREKGVGGAGVADSRDPLALSINPAGLVDVGRQYTLGLTAFSPDRGYWTSGPGFVAPGHVQSGRGLFPVPNGGYSSPIDKNSAWGVAVYGNGGMNTTYSPNYRSQFFGSPMCLQTGVYCSRNAGVDLNQVFITAGYAQRFGNLSIGFAPVLAVQIFKARGLAVFGTFSSAPNELTDHSYNWSVGAGVRAGLQYRLTDKFHGPGFGWSDIDVIKVGGEYRGFDRLALRLGYSYNNNPINSRDVTLNILAPAVTKHHISGGLSYSVTPSSSIDFAAVISPQGIPPAAAAWR